MTDADGADWPPELPAGFTPGRYHDNRCRHAGMRFGEVHPADELCICEPGSYGQARRRVRSLRRPEPSKAQLLQAQIDEAANIAARARLELERIKARPAEPDDDNPVIQFQYQFRPGGTVYQYAAVKAGGLWYTTGPKAPKGFTWEQLCDWLSESTTNPCVRQAKKFRPLEGAFLTIR